MLSALRDFVWLILAAVCLQYTIAEPSWKVWPYAMVPNDPDMTLPAAEAGHPQYQGDAWFASGELRGNQSNTTYRFCVIFNRNDIAGVRLNFYQVSIFNVDTGDYSAYTEYDYPIINLVATKLQYSSTELTLSFRSMYGNATWNHPTSSNGSYIPFLYQIHLPGIDKQGRQFLIDLKVEPMKYPSPYGGNILNGRFTFYDQPNTLSWFETGLQLEGTITWDNIRESVVGNTGHIDRHYFPLYAGVFSPTGRQVSHMWYQINLDNGVDLSVWVQYRRYQANKIVPTIGITTYEPNGNPINKFATDVNVTFLSFAKFPSTYNVLIPPPSPNRWIPGNTIIHCPSLNLQLTSTYSTKVPAIDLVIEYFEGPSHFVGTLYGQTVTGSGIQESTLALYRDWELENVLEVSARNLPPQSFNPAGPTATELADIIAGLNKYVNPNPLLENRIQAAAYARSTVLPAINTLVNVEDKIHLIQIYEDFLLSLSLPPQ